MGKADEPKQINSYLVSVSGQLLHLSDHCRCLCCWTLVRRDCSVHRACESHQRIAPQHACGGQAHQGQAKYVDTRAHMLGQQSIHKETENEDDRDEMKRRASGHIWLYEKN